MVQFKQDKRHRKCITKEIYIIGLSEKSLFCIRPYINKSSHTLCLVLFNMKHLLNSKLYTKFHIITMNITSC